MEGNMKTKPLTYLLSLTFLVLFSGSVYGQEEVKKEYWDNGKVKSETHYKDGKKDGLQTEWYENGQKKLEKNYMDGRAVDIATEWYENGQKKQEVFIIQHGEHLKSLLDKLQEIIGTNE